MEEPMTTEALYRALREEEEVLVVDCRSFMDYNQCHIHTAHNVHCPPIVRRRSGGRLTLDNVVRCAGTRARLQAGDYRLVVVYDERTENMETLNPNSTLLLVVNTLLQQAALSNVNFLKGGFQKFVELFPGLCDFGEGPLRPQGSHNSSEVRSPERLHKKVLQDKGGPVAVLPWMYLGNVSHATSPTTLRESNITALLNVSHLEITVPTAGLQYQCLPVVDSSTANISAWFPTAISFIDGVHEEKGRVLVHCQAGISRSATICLAYLMYHKHINLEQAFDYLKARREIISPNLNFMQQLLEFESQVIPQTTCKPRCRSPQSTAIEPSSNQTSKANCSGLKITLTPASTCVQEAAVFESTRSKRSPLLHSPALPLCPSPLLSPS